MHFIEHTQTLADTNTVDTDTQTHSERVRGNEMSSDEVCMHACMRNDNGDGGDGIQENREQPTKRIDDKIVRHKIMKKRTQQNKQGHQYHTQPYVSALCVKKSSGVQCAENKILILIVVEKFKMNRACGGGGEQRAVRKRCRGKKQY